MERKNSLVLVVVVLMFALAHQGFPAQKDERQKLIEAAAQEIEDLGLPYTDDYKISYNEDKAEVLVNFRTLPKFNVNYNLFYQRWWDAQFIALDCFRRRNIPVEVVRVETNFVDGSGPLAAITQTSYIEKYANAADGMTFWLDLSTLLLYDEEEGWKEAPR